MRRPSSPATEIDGSPASTTTCPSRSIHGGLPFVVSLPNLSQIRAGEHALAETEALPLQHGNLCLLVSGEHFLSRFHDESG